MSRKIIFDNPDDIIRRYLSGTSINQLSKELGCSRSVITRFLSENGTELRSKSDAETVKWKEIKQDPARVRRQMSAAWEASRGRTVSAKTKIKAAISFYRNASKPAGQHELELKSILEAELGIEVQWQYPIHTYNVDLAFAESRVAIEIENNRFNLPHTSLRKDRIEDILDRDWAVFMIFVKQRTKPSLLKIAEQCIAFRDFVRSNPSAIGKYGMIGRNGKRIAPSGYEAPDRPRVPNF